MAHTLDAAIDKGMTSILEARLTKTEILMERQSHASAAAMWCIQDLGETSQNLIRQQSDTVQKAAEEILKGVKMVLDLKTRVQQSREQMMDATRQWFGTQSSNRADVKNELASLSLGLAPSRQIFNESMKATYDYARGGRGPNSKSSGPTKGLSN
jgi:hypothetical protein